MNAIKFWLWRWLGIDRCERDIRELKSDVIDAIRQLRAERDEAVREILKEMRGK